MSSEQKLVFREYLVKTQHELRIKQDHLVVTIASAALTLSVAFIHKVVAIPDADWKVLLIMAWTALTISLSSVLLSIVTGIKSYDKEIFSIDQSIVNGKIEPLAGFRWGTISEILHIAGPVFLILGVIFNTGFVAVNMIGGETVQ